MTNRSSKIFAATLLAFAGCLVACGKSSSVSEPEIENRTAALVGNGLLEPGEQCDDGNAISGDGCSATGALEAGYLCHVSGAACSLASLCGNFVIDVGEACDDGNTTADGNGCSATCSLSSCGNGVLNDRQYPSFEQELCDDGNLLDGDGCSHSCAAEPGFACTGSPSRCVRSGVTLFSTGVDAQNRRLSSGVDPHWFHRGTSTGVSVGARNANDWPQEVPFARFMATTAAVTCASQDFLLPSTLDRSKLRVRISTFNDNTFDGMEVNGNPWVPVVVAEPAGQPWQKNVVRELQANAPWRAGLNRITICNENEASLPNAFRYRFVDAFDDACGDGAISRREECDDGNTTNGDGCSATCAIELGSACQGTPSACAPTCGNGALNGSEECDDGNTVNGDGCSASCRFEPRAGCGNGAIDPTELCDDGNTTSGDGCSAACRIERDYECFGAPSSCLLTCGNGRLDAGEQCDDGNARYGDGCSNACTFELGWACAAVGQPCAKTCGNGTMNPGERCDDGNLASGDGCSSDCRPETGFACSAPANGPSTCTNTCGNGNLDANETCDDGNLIAGDGCSAGCRVETGSSCSGVPSVCTTLCGDGVRAGNEQCDQGNGTNGDGCSAMCQIEAGWRCPAPGTVCFQTCGNGAIELGESCDDGNLGAGDGCDPFCRIEAGYACSGRPSTCAGRCGDGALGVGELCDDGNLSAGDGCTAACRPEAGYTCAGSPSVCTFDDTPPGATTITVPAAGAVLVESPVSIAGTADPESTVTVREDVEICTTTADATGAWSCSPAAPFAEGPHSIVATAVDGVGNVGAPSAARTFTVDTIAPDTSFTRQPASTTTETLASFGYAATEPVDRFECSLDGSAYAPCTSVVAVALGAHVLVARAVDLAGHVDASPAEARWTVERVTSSSSSSGQSGSSSGASEAASSGANVPADDSVQEGGGCNMSPRDASANVSWLTGLGMLLLRRARRRSVV